MASHPGHQKSELSRKLIASLYPIAVRNEFPLPSCFNKKSKLSNITLWDNRRKITDSRTQSDETLSKVSILANRPIPLCCSLYYYEVTVNAKSRSGCLLVGFFVSSQTEQKHKSSGTVIVYNSNTGRISVNEEQLPPVGPPFGEGDIIGCGVNFVTNSVFFTKNGLLIGLTNVSPQLTTAVFPCVQMVSPTTQLTGNFGHQDFYFAIGQHMAQERSSAVCQAVDNKLTSELANSKMRRIRMYRASVRSVLLYGCECWALRVEDERKLEEYDHHCLRTILRLKFTDFFSNETVRARCDNIARITQAIQERRLKWFGHALRRPPQELSVTALDPASLPHWRHRRGGQFQTWLDTVRHDMEVVLGPSVFGLCRWRREWVELSRSAAADRHAWRGTVRDIIETG
nr:unnamed protein product [Spirometra erinaceieuropaei]